MFTHTTRMRTRIRYVVRVASMMLWKQRNIQSCVRCSYRYSMMCGSTTPWWLWSYCCRTVTLAIFCLSIESRFFCLGLQSKFQVQVWDLRIRFKKYLCSRIILHHVDAVTSCACGGVGLFIKIFTPWCYVDVSEMYWSWCGCGCSLIYNVPHHHNYCVFHYWRRLSFSNRINNECEWMNEWMNQSFERPSVKVKDTHLVP